METSCGVSQDPPTVVALPEEQTKKPNNVQNQNNEYK